MDFSGAVSLEDPLSGLIPTKLSPWVQWANRGLNTLKRIWKSMALYRGCAETTREIWRCFSPGLGSQQLNLRDPFLARSSKEDSLFQSDKVSERACNIVWRSDIAHQGWTCREQGPPRKKQYTSAKDQLEMQHMSGLCPEDRFGCIGNIFAVRLWQFNKAEESAEVQDCRHGSLVSRRWQKSTKGCETIWPFR